MISTSDETTIAYKCSFNNVNQAKNPNHNQLSKESGNVVTTDGNTCCSLSENTFSNENNLTCNIQVDGADSQPNSPENVEEPRELSLRKETNRSSVTTAVIRPFKCYLCGLLFDRISQFDNHRRSVHHQERSQICQICGKGFFRQTDLKTHLNIHLGTNKCMCEVCGRKFNHVSNLIRHSRIHSGVKPYPCSICGKRFTQINTLARHKAIHARGDEIMGCCFCDKRFKSEIGLREHMKKLHGFAEKSNSEDNGRIIKRQHYCKICGESFQFVEILRVHEKTHQSVKTFECKSCGQKFYNTEEIKEHRCRRPELQSANTIRDENISEEELAISALIDDKNTSNSSRERKDAFVEPEGFNDDFKTPSSSYEIYTSTENSGFNRCKNSIDSDPDKKLCCPTTTSSIKFVEDKQAKETIVYVTTEQLASMNTEQVIDTANHFLHQHLMELAAENALQSENINSRDCSDGDTVVSEMINDCWKEIDIPDDNESDISEKRVSLISKNNTPSIIYIHASDKDGLIYLNEYDNVLGNIAPDLAPEKNDDIKNDLIPIKNLNSRSSLENLQTIKICENDNAKKHSLDLSHNETKLQNHKQDRRTSVTTASKTQNTRNYFNQDNSNVTDPFLIETVSPSTTATVFEERLKINSDSVNTVISKSLDNQEPRLRLVQTENGEEFYELLITNRSERSENYFESDKIPTAIVNENLRTLPNEPVPESLLKLIQLENGQRVLGLTRNTLSDETEECKDSEDTEQPVMNSSFVERISLENVDERGSRQKNSLQNKCEKIFYLAQNNRDNFIDFFEIDTRGVQEQSSFNTVSNQVLENVSQTSFDNSQLSNKNKSLVNDESLTTYENCEDLLGLIQNNPLKNNEKRKIESKKSRSEEGPMVRLVQNEDGAQFFELIRGDLEFDETQDFELVETDDLYQEKKDTGQLAISAKSSTNLNPEAKCTINGTSKLESDITRKKKQKHNAKKYNCEVCKKSFSKGYNYRQHIGTHFADQQKYKCKECGTFFAWKSTLNKHMATHRAGGQQKFVCEICPKVYTTLSQVNEHVKRDHLKERNHKCVHCEKTFFKKFDLKIHIRTHTKERPYECRVCYKSFHHQSHIIRHERIHSGERPYACNICEKTFTQLGSLKNHRQRHREFKIDILDYQMDEDDPLPRTTL